MYFDENEQKYTLAGNTGNVVRRDARKSGLPDTARFVRNRGKSFIPYSQSPCMMVKTFKQRTPRRYIILMGGGDFPVSQHFR
jgi:hypothetical protein